MLTAFRTSGATAVLIGVGAWAAETALFALTAALTALVIAALPDVRDREDVLEEYRARAFDVFALFTAATVLVTGFGLAQIAIDEATKRDPADWLIRIALMFVVDTVGAVVLLTYSHQLVTHASQRRIPQLLRELRSSLRAAAESEASSAELRRVTAPYGLRLEQEFFGAAAIGHPIWSERRVGITDIRLSRLARWLRALTGILPGDAKAITALRLGVIVLAGWPLASVSPADRDKASGLFNALELDPSAQPHDFELTVKRVTDSAADAAKKGHLADFEEHVDALSALFLEVYALKERVRNLQANWLTTLIGWQPEVQFTGQFRRLGPEVLAASSEPVIRSWLYAIQQLAIESRAYPERDLQALFAPWVQVAGTPALPEGIWEAFWMRIHEYSTYGINMWLSRAQTEEQLAPLRAELRSFLLALRWIVVQADPMRFVQIRAIVNELGSDLPRAGFPNDAGGIQSAKRRLADELDRLKGQFWLGYAGEMLTRVAEGRLTHAQALSQWPTIRESFSSLGEAWRAWDDIGTHDALSWSGENQARARTAARARGEWTFGGFVDGQASTSLPFALLALSLGQNSGFPEGAEIRALSVEIQGLLAGYSTRQRCGSPMSADARKFLEDRAALLRARIAEATHATEVSEEGHIAAAQPDEMKIRNHLDHFLQSIDRDGLLLMEGLANAGRTQFGEVLEDVTTAGVRGTIHKGSLVPGSLPPILDRRLLGEEEDVAILQPMQLVRRAKAVKRNELGAELDADLADMQNRGTPASHLILPWDLDIVTELVGHSGDQLDVQGRLRIGSYRGVAMYRGPQPWPHGLAVLLSLPHWAAVTIQRPVAGTDSLHPRFTAVIRPPNDAELAKARQEHSPQSRAGLPFRNEDLEVAISNQWHLEVLEHFKVEETDADAIRVYVINAEGPQSPVNRRKARPRSTRKGIKPGATDVQSYGS